MAGLTAVTGDFVGLNAEQLARAGRQSDDEAVQVRLWLIFENVFHVVDILREASTSADVRRILRLGCAALRRWRRSPP